MLEPVRFRWSSERASISTTFDLDSRRERKRARCIVDVISAGCDIQRNFSQGTEGIFGRSIVERWFEAGSRTRSTEKEKKKKMRRKGGGGGGGCWLSRVTTLLSLLLLLATFVHGDENVSDAIRSLREQVNALLDHRQQDYNALEASLKRAIEKNTELFVLKNEIKQLR